jgi:uncharacterized protein (TIGR02231 family)
MTVEDALITGAAKMPRGARAIEAPVMEVTIAEGQADVRREGRVAWENSGLLMLFIFPVTPLLIDSTLWAEIRCDKDTEMPELGSIRAIRWLESPEKSDGGREAEILDRLDIIGGEVERLGSRGERLNLRTAGIKASIDPTIMSVLENVASLGMKPSDYAPILQNLLGEIDMIYREDFELKKQGQDLMQQLEGLKGEWSSLPDEQGQRFARAGILVSLDLKGRGEGTIRCGYGVPCAQWRPRHEAHLMQDDRALLVTHGVIWQNTGEDWKDICLTLSTAKPSLGLDAELPGEDMLELREKTREERKTIRIMARDQAIQKTGLADELMEEPPLPVDGGETQIYRLPEKVTLMSQRRPHFFKIDQLWMDATTSLYAAPELDSHVFHRSIVRNTQARPILAGPVLLQRKGIFIGAGRLDFVGPNEVFHLWWGSEDLLSISRYVDEKTDDPRLLQGPKIHRTISLHMRNLSGEATFFQLHERVPTSELEQIRVKVKDLPERASGPDSDGFIMIEVDMGPGEEKTIGYSYTLDIDRDVDYQGVC